MDQLSIKEQAFAMSGEISAWYRHFHQHPELSFQEFKTTETIGGILEAMGAEVCAIPGTTGLTALIRGGRPGRTIVLRADIDALPVHEESAVSFRSEQDGVMQACGHDAHMAILLGAANLIMKNKDRLKGCVKLVFQPAEEVSAGARKILSAGVMDDPDIEAALALHVMPDAPSGHIQVKPGVIFSAQDEFHIDLKGIGGHGSAPHKAIDPIIAGAQLVTALQTIVSRKADPTSPAVVSVCQFTAGSRPNIIPETASIAGTVRSQDEQVHAMIHEQIEMIIKGVCLASGTRYQMEIKELLPMMVNDIDLTGDFIQKASEILDRSSLEILQKPYMYSEDFAYFAHYAPSMLFLLGCRNEEKGCVHPLHSPFFKIDEDILPLGSALFAHFCLERDDHRGLEDL